MAGRWPSVPGRHCGPRRHCGLLVLAFFPTISLICYLLPISTNNTKFSPKSHIKQSPPSRSLNPLSALSIMCTHTHMHTQTQAHTHKHAHRSAYTAHTYTHTCMHARTVTHAHTLTHPVCLSKIFHRSRPSDASGMRADYTSAPAAA